MTLLPAQLMTLGAISGVMDPMNQNVLPGQWSDLYIANKVVSPDGFERSAVLAGGSGESLTFPGPLIIGEKNGDFNLNVVNRLTDPTMLLPTSIHWHGFFQKGSSWADGPAGVTQCPIVPDNSFLYSFKAEDQAGTFWYHSHHSTQYCDGLRGPIVVYDKNDPYKHMYDFDDSSTVITLADWYHVPAPSAGIFPTADSTLVNGFGRYSGGPASPLAVIKVVPGKSYRFRLVSISCDPHFDFSIDSHTMTIIEVDGILSELLEVDQIQIFAGQRYSFILTANQLIDNYWIRSNPSSGIQGYDGGINSAILRYVGASEVDPVTTSVVTNPLIESNLRTKENPGAPGVPVLGAADLGLNLGIAFNRSNFLINGATFQETTVPVLLQIISGAKSAQELLPIGSVYSLPRNSVIELTIPGNNAPGGPHPFHLHGHAFDVVRSAGSNTYNFDNPIRRDVVSIGNGTDNVTIRFTTDNPGPWILHCHIDWHLELGLAVVFAEDIEGISDEPMPPSEWNTLCPSYETYINQD